MIMGDCLYVTNHMEHQHRMFSCVRKTLAKLVYIFITNTFL